MDLITPSHIFDSVSVRVDFSADLDQNICMFVMAIGNGSLSLDLDGKVATSFIASLN